MTATPLREDNRDTYLYFGNPIYEYSLRARHRRRLPRALPRASRRSRNGTRPDGGRARTISTAIGRAIPDDEYQTKDFERVIALRARTRGHRPPPDRFPEKDRPLRQDHRVLRRSGARQSEMRQALVNLNADLVAQYPDYVCRVTADEGDIGRGHLAQVPRRRNQDAGYPHHVATAHDRRRCADLQECRAGARRRVHERIQADHRARHPPAR